MSQVFGCTDRQSAEGLSTMVLKHAKASKAAWKIAAMVCPTVPPAEDIRLYSALAPNSGAGPASARQDYPMVQLDQVLA